MKEINVKAPRNPLLGSTPVESWNTILMYLKHMRDAYGDMNYVSPEGLGIELQMIHDALVNIGEQHQASVDQNREQYWPAIRVMDKSRE